MCLIITRKKHAEPIDMDAANRAARKNADGYGIAYPLKGKVEIVKSMKWAPVRKLARDLEKKNIPFVLHMRWATNGAVKPENNHPFKLNGGIAMAHNGILTEHIEVPRGVSDSKVFARMLSRNMTPGFIHDAEIMDFLEDSIGSNRIAFIDQDGEIRFLNEHLGIEVAGVWYSQESAIAPPVRRRSYATYNPAEWKDNYQQRRAQKLLGFNSVTNRGN